MSRPPAPMDRPPPQGQYRHAPNNRGPPPPQQYYDDGYQQDWDQGGYDGYTQGQQQSYDQYGTNGYQNEQAYDYNGGYGQGGYYEGGGYEGYGPGYEQRSPPRQRLPPDDRRRGPPPQQGMRGPPRGAPRPQGLPGSDPRQGRPPRGPPQDQWGRPMPPSSDPRARSRSRPRQRDDRYYDRGPPPPDQQQRGWDDSYSGRPPPPGNRGPTWPRPGDDAGLGQMPPQRRTDPYDANEQYQPGYGPQAEGQAYHSGPQQQRPPPPGVASMRDQDNGNGNRAPLPQFQSVKHHPQDPRSGASSATERPLPPQQKQLPPQPHATPATVVDGSFNKTLNQQQNPQQWPAPAHSQAPIHNNQNFSLPVRPAQGAATSHTTARSEEMPNFGSDSQAQPNAAYQRPQFQSNDPISPAGPISPIHQLPPQQPEERFEMPGDMPVTQPPPRQQYGAPPAQAPQGYRLPQRSQTQSPQGQGQKPNGFGPPRRQITDGPQPSHAVASHAEPPRGPSPYARDEHQQGYALNGAARHGVRQGPQRQDSNFSDHSGSGRPRTPGGSRPNTAGVDRPAYYPAMDAYGSPQGQGRGPQSNGRAPPQQPPNGYPPQGRPSGDTQRRPFAKDPSQRSDPNQRFDVNPGQQRPPLLARESNQGQTGTRHARQNSDALPAHPAPSRPGLPNSSSEEKPKPTPVRQYTNNNPDIVATNTASKPQTTPVTQAELANLREKCARSPSDSKTLLLLAKKLVEASHVLADDSGRAPDPRTRAANSERYTKEALKIVRKLASAQYPDALFYLADSYGDGALGLPPDPREAFTLYQSAAKLNHPQSAYRTAVCCEIGAEEGGGTKRDFAKAVQWYRRAAQLGDIPSTYKMGVILLKGLLNQPPDLREAVVYLRKASDKADAENPHALHELAMIYESPPPQSTSSTNNSLSGSTGGTILKDEAEALRLFTAAAKLGYKFSQFKLGQCHEYGHLNAPIDARSSIIWYTKAAAQGEHQAELALSGWYLTGAEGILEHSDTEAYLWARKAACSEAPVPKAMFAMGYFTEVGIGCPRSVEEARRWYGRAAAHNFPKARERLEELRRNGSRTQKPREKLNRGAGGDQKKNDENCIIM